MRILSARILVSLSSRKRSVRRRGNLDLYVADLNSVGIEAEQLCADGWAIGS